MLEEVKVQINKLLEEVNNFKKRCIIANDAIDEIIKNIIDILNNYIVNLSDRNFKIEIKNIDKELRIRLFYTQNRLYTNNENRNELLFIISYSKKHNPIVQHPIVQQIETNFIKENSTIKGSIYHQTSVYDINGKKIFDLEQEKLENAENPEFKDFGTFGSYNDEIVKENIKIMLEELKKLGSTKERRKRERKN